MATNSPLPFKPFQTAPERAFATSSARPDPQAALVFVDTNVLLAPYKASSEALTAIEVTFRTLRGQNRLIVPAQVAREFASNRPNLVAQLHKVVSDSRSLSINGRLDGVPILLGTPEYEEAQACLARMQTELRGFRSAVEKLVSRIASWERVDPVLNVYSKLLTAEVVRDLSVDAAQLEALRKSRFEAKVPPGFRDKNKDDGGVGDLAIWLTILEVCEQEGRDAIFITEDSKDDWFHRSGESRLFPRYELVEEFAERTGGKSFGAESLSSLLKQYGASDKVVQEVRETEVPIWRSLIDKIGHTTDRAAALILNRISAVDRSALVGINEEQGVLDLAIKSNEERLCIEILNVHQFQHPSHAEQLLRRALRVQRDEGFYEVALLFVSRVGEVEAAARWAAEPMFQVAGISTMAAVLAGDALDFFVNNAAHPFLRSTFS